jgi:hypothetical protein
VKTFWATHVISNNVLGKKIGPVAKIRPTGQPDKNLNMNTNTLLRGIYMKWHKILLHDTNRKASISQILWYDTKFVFHVNTEPFLTSPLSPSGEICHLGGIFTPSFTPPGVNTLLFRRMEGRTEDFTPRG